MPVAYHSHFTFENQPQNKGATQKSIQSVENCKVRLNTTTVLFILKYC